jgi:hypothetical protein
LSCCSAGGLVGALEDPGPDLREGAAERAKRDRLAALVAAVRRGDARDEPVAGEESSVLRRDCGDSPGLNEARRV